jgi:hypothetical protein
VHTAREVQERERSLVVAGAAQTQRERERERERRGETKFAVEAMKERCSKACAKTETVQLVQQLIIITYTGNKYLLYQVAVAIIILITYVHNIAQVVTAAGMYVLTALSSSFMTLHAHIHYHCYIYFLLLVSTACK